MKTEQRQPWWTGVEQDASDLVNSHFPERDFAPATPAFRTSDEFEAQMVKGDNYANA